VSNCGRVKIFNGEMLRQFLDKNGYSFVVLHKNETEKNKKVSELVYCTFKEK